MAVEFDKEARPSIGYDLERDRTETQRAAEESPGTGH
jgi:hypothetical protein